MEITTLDQQTTVSPQMVASDVDHLLELGVEVLVCNRPDGESEGQPTFNEIEAAAKEKGLEVVNIPFTGGQMTEEHISAFAEVLGKGKRTHAYCRTGNRCTQVWTAATQSAGS